MENSRKNHVLFADAVSASAYRCHCSASGGALGQGDVCSWQVKVSFTDVNPAAAWLMKRRLLENSLAVLALWALQLKFTSKKDFC